MRATQAHLQPQRAWWGDLPASPPPPLAAGLLPSLRTHGFCRRLAAAARFEQQHGRFPDAADGQALAAAWAEEAGTAGVDTAALPAEALAAYASEGEDMPAINAIVGGVVANEVIKALGRKGAPINNLFLFSLLEGAGAVERMPPPAAVGLV